jgi:hypothetical protein
LKVQLLSSPAVHLPQKSILPLTDKIGSTPSATSFTVLYAGAALGCGLLALYKEKPVIITTTALLGAFGFFIGVGYFQECNFMQVAELLEHDIGRPLDKTEKVTLDECDRVLAFGWIFMSALGVLLQYRSVDRCGDSSTQDLTDMKADRRYGAALRGSPRELLVIRDYRSGRRRNAGRRDRRRDRQRSPSRVTKASERLLLSGAESGSSTTSRCVDRGPLHRERGRCGGLTMTRSQA